MSDEKLTIINKTRSALPRADFRAIKNAAMGAGYSLSLVFIGERRSRRLNNAYRGKDKPTNILSFPYDKKSGEIFITLSVAKRQHKKFDRSFDNFVAFLLIHGLTHLKGFDHGSRMERAEEKLRKQFSI
jgi:probable rRNA maturation factor